jgi:putative ABC transport system permease protein
MLIKIAFRNIFRNGRRTAFCVAAVGIAVFFIVFYQGFIGGFTRNINDVIQIFDLGHISVVSARFEAENEYSPVQYPVADGADWREMAASIEALPGVKAALPRIKSYATLQESVVKHAALWGLRLDDERALHNFNLTDRNDGLIEGRWYREGSNECVIGRRFAEKAGLSVGSRIPLKTVSAQFSDKMWSPEIVGIYNFDYLAYDDGVIIVDFDRLQRLLVLGNGTQQLLVYADNENRSAALAEDVAAIVAAANTGGAAGAASEPDVVRQWQDSYFAAYMSAAKPMYTFIFLIFLIVASFLIINTITMIIHERIKEIGMMGSLGMTRAEIVRVFFLESFFLSVAGALAGVVLGGITTGILQFVPFRWADITGSAYASFPASNALYLTFSVGALAQGFFMGILVASIFTLLPSLKSAKVEPVEALRR